LFSINIASGKENILSNWGRDLRPASPLYPGIRFSLVPDGKSFVYAVAKSKSNLWMLEGFEPKTNLLSRWFRWLK
jgi:hypothetical protein